MTELQMGLIGLGAVAVVAVVAYNKWQEMRQRKQAEEILNSRHPDVLFGEAADGQFRRDAVDGPPDLQPDSVADDVPGTETDIGRESELPPSATADPYAERIEPVWRPETEAEAPLAQASMAVESAVERNFPTAAATAFEGAADGSAVGAETPVGNVRDEMRDVGETEVTEPLHLLSPFLDYVASFEAVEPAPAYQILQSRSGALARIRKPVQWVGYNEFAREWEPIVDDGRNEYRRLRVGVQLVDRQGALGEGDLSVFHIAMQELADELMAIVDLPPRQPALNNAAKIDEFCASVDIQIGINLISQGQAFAGTKLRALAEAAGMVIDAEGRFVRCDEDGLFGRVDEVDEHARLDLPSRRSARGARRSCLQPDGRTGAAFCRSAARRPGRRQPAPAFRERAGADSPPDRPVSVDDGGAEYSRRGAPDATPVLLSRVPCA
jgi:hypothetical protein